MASTTLLPVVFPIAGKGCFEAFHVCVGFDLHHPGFAGLATFTDNALGDIETSFTNISREFPIQFATINDPCNRQCGKVINEQVRREKPRCDLNVKQHQLLWVISLMLACKRFGPKVFGERYFSGIVVVVRFQQTK